VQTGDNVLIAGTIVLGNAAQRVLVRAIGPSLTVAGKLGDPTLELRDGNGGLLRSNDNWKDTQQAEIIATTIPPTNDLEAAIVATLPANGAAYTAILRGANNTTGIAVVEIYGLNSGTPTPTPAGTPSPTPAGTPSPTPAASPTPTPAGTPTPTPAPKLFIVNGGNNTVTASNLDGTGGTALAIPAGLLNGPQGIAINATAGRIYVSNEAGNSITQSNLAGSMAVNVTFNPAVMVNGPYGVALDVPGNKIYIANGGNNAIVRADLDGGNAASLGNLNNLLGTPQGMAIDVMNNKMYVANSAAPNKGIIRADLDGMNANVILSFNAAPLDGIPIDVALNVAANRMYVVDVNGNLFSADLNGGNAMQISTPAWQLNMPRGMGVDVTGGKMYISNSGNNTVTQADLPDGANPVVLNGGLPIATLNMPAVVAVYRAP